MAAEVIIGLSYKTTQRQRYQGQGLQHLSETQRDLRLRIYNERTANVQDLRTARNKVLHQIRDRCRDLANRILDEKASHIENMSDSTWMYAAVREIARRGHQPLLLTDGRSPYQKPVQQPAATRNHPGL
ncbi:hypothetical protein ON010_g18996 [Phytophthora cinnamomi]|nr:hypothetical protein ON010_g18996 [Phytophthora cinnamomi]